MYIYLQNNDLTYAYYISLAEAMIRNQSLAWIESPTAAKG